MDSRSYYPNYFTIEDILATNERLPCKVLDEIPGLGFLDPSSANENLKAGTVLEFPLWLVKSVAVGRNRVITPEIPKIYKEQYREILQADACAVDLSRLCNFFYEVGSYMCQFDVRGTIAETLIETFKNRFRYIMDLSQNTENSTQSSNKLDNLEESLLKNGINTTLLMDEWLLKGHSAIAAGQMVTGYKKRKRDALDE
ncbi:DNA replication complex GINS protein PSF3-like [Ctenocephalides felis]|uniref:DNA replication complex GINS protein PSF3-like n=1 Tax=Ctenocephalides felis TaxID=7515 RepID=UPI000E6E5AC2|nr:DNA replication complex GINS protein PSF3-like [Ctenocephalides felis]